MKRLSALDSTPKSRLTALFGKTSRITSRDTTNISDSNDNERLLFRDAISAESGARTAANNVVRTSPTRDVHARRKDSAVLGELRNGVLRGVPSRASVVIVRRPRVSSEIFIYLSFRSCVTFGQFRSTYRSSERREHPAV